MFYWNENERNAVKMCSESYKVAKEASYELAKKHYFRKLLNSSSAFFLLTKETRPILTTVQSNFTIYSILY